MDGYRDKDDQANVGAPPTAEVFVATGLINSRSILRRLVFLVAGTLLPLILMVSLIVFGAYRSAQRQAGERVLQLTKSTMALVDRELQSTISGLEVLALVPELQNGDFVGFADDAKRFLTRFPPGTGLFVADSSGQLLLNTLIPPGQPLPKRGQTKSVEATFTTNKPYVSDMFVGAVSHRAVFSVDVPVRRGDQVIYNLAIVPPREGFYKILKDLELPDRWVVSIFDRNAHHVARLPRLSDEVLTTGSESMRKALASDVNNRILRTVSLEGTEALSAFTRSPESGWTVAIGMPLNGINAPAWRALMIAVAIGAAMRALGLFFAVRLARQLVRAETNRDLLMHELNHRVKNTLSAVQGIVLRGLPKMPETISYRTATEARLAALSNTHNILGAHNWQNAGLREIAAAVVKPYVNLATQSLKLDGPNVVLMPRIAIPLAMILNELATNAVKHGALLSPSGKLTVIWTLAGADRLQLEWREEGGPSARPPEKFGYGTKFIERAVTGELNGSYEAAYASEGFTCTIAISL